MPRRGTATVVRGQTLGGRYHLVDVLGVGGMSVVWRAHDDVLGRDVAVKLLSGHYAADAVSRHRIRVEARAAAALAHPNVAQVYDFGETVEDGRRTPYVVMELVPGPTLEEQVAAGPLPPATVFRICAEIAAGLAAAHADGLVHRDVKPANVILAPTGAKVVDFGIAVAVDPAGGGLEDELLGTADYVAPERITDDAITPASDVYSLGVLLYKLLAGHLPWTASGSTELLEAHVFAAPAPLPDLPDVPADVVDLCQRCLAKTPTQRPSAAQAAATLAAAAGASAVDTGPAHTVAPPAVDSTPSSVPVGTTDTSTSFRVRRGRLAVAVLATAAVALVTWNLVPASDKFPPAAADNDAVPTHATIPAAAPTTSGTTSVAPTQAANGPGGVRVPAATDSPAATNPATPPGTATPQTSTNPPSPTPARTFTSDGGTVTARCVRPGVAELVSWTATAPYKVDWVNAGPAAAATAAFAHGNRTVALTVTCDGTTPTASTN
jgi:serine/threonine-protein kinase